MGRNSRNRSELPVDIVHEILLCLSVKHLTKFKCVCKPWSSLISAPFFQQEHYRRSSKQDPLFLIKKFDSKQDPLLPLKKFDVEAIPTFQYSAIINNRGLSLVNNFSKSTPKRKPILDERKYPFQSCLGLVGVYSLKHEMFLFDPSTEEIMNLPPTKGSNACVGFGYAAPTKEFKVVRFFERSNDKGKTETPCEVFTLGTDTWREARMPPYRVSWSYTPFLHGAFYLKPDDYEERDGYIVAFDINYEECRGTHIRFPEYYYNAADDCEMEGIEMRELEGSLCLTFGIKRCIGSMALWLLKEKNQWVKGYKIDLASSIKLLNSAVPILFLRDGTMLMEVFTEEEVMLALYDPKRKMVTKKISSTWSPVPYVESFFRLSM